MRTIEIYLVSVNRPIDETTVQYLLNYVQPEKQERILRQKIKQNADTMLIGDILAKAMLKKTFGITCTNRKFAYSQHGKPYLPEEPNVHFSISHSGEFVVCAVSEQPVGVDIQKIAEFHPRVAQRVCNETELRQIEISSDKASEFTKLWVQKEAVVKLCGTGIAGSDMKNCLADQSAYFVKSRKIGDCWLASATENQSDSLDQINLQTFDFINFIKFIKSL